MNMYIIHGVKYLPYSTRGAIFLWIGPDGCFVEKLRIMDHYTYM